nr:unnamed protein product [Callosobruchus chinensis]
MAYQTSPVIHRAQSRILRSIADAPWHVSNQKLHGYSNIPNVMDVIQKRSTRFHARLDDHPNPLIPPLLLGKTRRLKENYHSISFSLHHISLDWIAKKVEIKNLNLLMEVSSSDHFTESAVRFAKCLPRKWNNV